MSIRSLHLIAAMALLRWKNLQSVSNKCSGWFRHMAAFVHLVHSSVVCTVTDSDNLVILLQADIKPKVDGCNGLRYDLTVDIIDSIFRTYPAGIVDKFMVYLANFIVHCWLLVRFVCSCCVCRWIIFNNDTSPHVGHWTCLPVRWHIFCSISTLFVRVSWMVPPVTRISAYSNMFWIAQ